MKSSWAPLGWIVLPREWLAPGLISGENEPALQSQQKMAFLCHSSSWRGDGWGWERAHRRAGCWIKKSSSSAPISIRQLVQLLLLLLRMIITLSSIFPFLYGLTWATQTTQGLEEDKINPKFLIKHPPCNEWSGIIRICFSTGHPEG